MEAISIGRVGMFSSLSSCGVLVDKRKLVDWID